MEGFVEQQRWVQVDLTALSHNYHAIRDKLTPQVQLLAVVKADAYGHGAVETSRKLEALGAEMLGVTTVAEGLALRQGGIKLPILIFSPFMAEEAETIVVNELTATISSLEAITWLGQVARKLGKETAVHLKVETGMGRTGIWPQDIVTAAKNISDYTELRLSGVYSHLATATWSNATYAEKQFAIFNGALRQLEEAGYQGLIRHIANSAALLRFPHMHLDMVRTGTLLFGQYPAPWMAKHIKLLDTWSFWARVSYIRELPAGSSVGYGRTYITRKPTRVAVLPVGYCDGLQMEPVLRPVNLIELLKGMAKLFLLYIDHARMAVPVTFAKGRGRIIGKVGMQLSMVDITGISEVQVGSVAKIPLRRTAVDPLIAKVYLEDSERELKLPGSE